MLEKRKLSFFIVMFLMFSFILLALSGCSKTRDRSIYVNDEYGFSIEFPESWRGEFEVNPYDYGLIISSETNDITTLAYIHKYTSEEWQDMNYGADIPLPYQILEENTGAVFALIYPGDVNYDIENKNSVKKYKEMITDLGEENFTFKSND